MSITSSVPDGPQGSRAHRATTGSGPGHDLHDLVIQRLFATGLSLQSALALLAHDPVTAGQRIERALDDLDGTVRALHAHRPTKPAGWPRAIFRRGPTVPRSDTGGAR